MEELLTKIFKSFKEFFTQLSVARKFGLVAVVVIIIMVMASLITWASKTHYEVLYTDLNDEDSTQIARMLEEKGINYQLEDGGKTIKLPEEQVGSWRLELAKKGVNFTGTVGYEVFDKQSFGTSTFVQKVNKQRALEGELIKTIRYIKGVKRARVHLSIPDSSPFATELKDPNASVVLELDRGVVLTPEEIKGIGSLVSSAVERLRPEKVVIVDARGKKLSDNVGDAMTAYTANRIALENQINRKFENQVEEILSKVVGTGKVVAKVNVTLDFTEKVSTETTFDEETKATLSEVVNTQKLLGSRPSPQGIPGARSNLPGEKPQPGIPETRNDVDKKLATRNFQVPQKLTKSKKPVAEMKNISVAVMVDGKYTPMLAEDGSVIVNEDGVSKKKYTPWTEADIENFKEVVASTIGLNTARGDKLVIRNMEFIKEDLSEIDALIAKRENREILKNIIKYLAIGIIVTLFFVFVIRPFIHWITENTVESIEDFLPKTIEELEKIQANQKLPGLEDALPEMDEVLNPEKIEGNMLREKVITLVENNPAKAAQVLQALMHSGDNSKNIA